MYRVQTVFLRTPRPRGHGKGHIYCLPNSNRHFAALAATADYKQSLSHAHLFTVSVTQPAFNPFNNNKNNQRTKRQPSQTILQTQTQVQNQSAETKESRVSEISPLFYLPLRFRVPEKVEKYTKGKMIGSGFFATVYEGIYNDKVEKVAIKEIAKMKCPKEVFTKELDIMRYVQSFSNGNNGLGAIKDVFETPEKVSFVLQLCEGGDLFDYVATNGAQKEETAKVVIRDLAFALDTLHSHDVLHRDVKLENILLTKKGPILTGSSVSKSEPSGQMQLVDFGYAKRVGDKDVFRNPAGTFGYVAPEVLKPSRVYTTKCDIWSAGVVLYTMLAGYQPFPYELPKSLVANSGTLGLAYKKANKMELIVKAELDAILLATEKDNWNDEMNRAPFDKVSDQAKDLLAGMLEVNPSKRLSAAQVLSHPWLAGAEINNIKGERLYI